MEAALRYARPDDGGHGASRAAQSAAAFVLEGELQLGAVGRDLAFFDDQVLLEDLGDAQVAQRLGGPITATVAAFSQDSLLVPTSSITL